jgi:hypothetical protein
MVVDWSVVSAVSQGQLELVVMMVDEVGFDVAVHLGALIFPADIRKMMY